MERRVVFSGWVCPVVLLLPQLAVTIVFFFWPAGQAVLQSVRGGDAFGLSTRFVGVENFAALAADPDYLAAFAITAFFSLAVALLALAPGLLLAVMADRVVRGAAFYKTVLRSPASSGCFCSTRRSASLPRRCVPAGSTGTICSTATRRCSW
jgi:sn-glycerol 3-phosphate transport system permease protein